MPSMMIKPGKTGLWLAVSLALVAVVCVLVSSRPKPVRYQGKRFYQWASELQEAQANYNDPDRQKKIESAAAAIRAMGTNGLPLVMADLRARSTLKDGVIAWLAPRAKFLKLKPVSVSERWVRGIRAMEVLGPLGKPYLPEIITMVSNSTGYFEGALIAIGPDALPAFTNLLAHSKYPQTGNLIAYFSNAVYANRITPEQAAVALPYLVQVFKSTDSHGRWYAASAFGAIHQEPDVCIPLLISGLTDPNASVRESCARSLGAFGDAASEHAGKLADIFDQMDALTRRSICSAMGNFRSAAAECVPVLVRGAADPDLNVRVAAVTALGQLAAMPEEAIPALSQAVKDPNQVVRLMAAQSLGLFGKRATNALPVLERARSDPDASVRDIVGTAIKRINEGW